MNAHFLLPQPQDWNTLEDIVCDVVTQRFSNHNFQRYGRNGQAQEGLDIAGITPTGLLGIQCKHHPEGDIPLKEITESVKKAEKFRPGLSEYLIFTSAKRDTKAHQHVLKFADKRKALGKFPVGIKFWEDLCAWLDEYPDLVYKHFTRFFKLQDVAQVKAPHLLHQPKITANWPVSSEVLDQHIDSTLAHLPRVGPYQLTVGISSFPEISFQSAVDVDVSLADAVQDEDLAVDGFQRAHETLRELRAMLSLPSYSKSLVVFLQTRLALALLVGWTFRKVSHFDLLLVSGKDLWPTSGLPYTVTGLVDDLPKLFNAESSEVALVLNISRNIDASVVEHINTQANLPKAILTISLPGNTVTSAAHASSIALDISLKIKTLVDRWRVTHIHLFGAMPAGLAALIGYHLNAICPISIYFLDNSRRSFKLAGRLTNES